MNIPKNKMQLPNWFLLMNQNWVGKPKFVSMSVSELCIDLIGLFLISNNCAYD